MTIGSGAETRVNTQTTDDQINQHVAAHRHGPSNPIVERFLEFLKDELDTDRILEDMEHLESGVRTQRGMAFRG